MTDPTPPYRAEAFQLEKAPTFDAAVIQLATVNHVVDAQPHDTEHAAAGECRRDELDIERDDHSWPQRRVERFSAADAAGQ